MSMEEYEIECLKSEAWGKHEKIYAVAESWDDGVHYYDINYYPTKKTEKFLRFSFIEHYLQFVDLLHEAGYKYFDEKLRFVNDIN